MRKTLLTLACFVLPACGQYSPDDMSSRIAARVGNGKITLRQLNRSLADTAGANAHADQAQALEALIDEELLIQKAVENQVERDPDVMEALADSRGRILADAYTQHWVIPHEPIPEKDIRDFFERHPELFEKRRIYRLHHFHIDSLVPDETMKGALDLAHGPEAVRAVLDEYHAVFFEDSQTMPAEQLSLELAGIFSTANPGDMAITPKTGEKTILTQVLGFSEEPIFWEQAKPSIEAYLLRQRNQQAVEAHLKQLRAAADIRYLGEFAKAQTAAAERRPPHSQD